MSDLAIEELSTEWGEEAPGLIPAHIFASPICGCGRAKLHGNPLCYSCWNKAPKDLRAAAWKRNDQQMGVLMELRRILEHAHDPVKPGHVRVCRPVIKGEINGLDAAVGEHIPIIVREPYADIARNGPPDSETQIQSSPERAPRFIVRLTENQMDRFLVSASPDWKQQMVQSLLDAEDE